MGENVPRIRLLVAVGAAALLAVLAAWPSPGAAAEPAPLYLVRERDAGAVPESNTFLAVADGPRLVAHVAADRERLVNLEVIDGTGRVVLLQPDGTATATGQVIDPGTVRLWLSDSFSVRWSVVDRWLLPSGPGQACWNARQAAQDRLDLPTHQDGRERTLAEVLTEADSRLTAMHRPEGQIPFTCYRRTWNGDHRAGYLHNLWHRITGS